MRWSHAVLGVCLGLLSVHGAQAAVLRHDVRVEGTRVHLSDLFSGLLPGQDTEIGDAPKLGESYVVGGPQLTAIAAQFGVDWPDASPIISLTVTRSARKIDENELILLIRWQLSLSESSRATISLNDYKPIALPLSNHEQPVLVQLDPPQGGTGHFSARFDLSAGTDDSRTINVTGTVITEVQVVKLKRAVKAGDIVLPEDIEMALVKSNLAPQDALQNLQDVAGMQVRSPMSEGQIVSQAKLDHPQLIHRGSPVVVSFVTPGLHVTVSGTAMEAGGKGDTVHIFNPSTRMILTGRVIERSEVEIIPGAMPVSAEDRHRNASLQNIPML